MIKGIGGSEESPGVQVRAVFERSEVYFRRHITPLFQICSLLDVVTSRDSNTGLDFGSDRNISTGLDMLTL